jgi:serine/threonine-protein kinase
VLDFGVAKFAVEEHDDDYATLTQVGAIIGTPRYMSPEQCSGAAPLTPASDVYSLGIILYEMLAGSVPFSAETPIAVALKQVSEAPQPLRELAPSVPPQLEQIVLHALAKNPPARPQSANDLRHELIGVADQLGYEHAESARSPTLDQLRTAGTESPSGRLVIDLATLRQVQAAVGTRNADAAPPPQGSEPPQREIRRMQVSLDRPPAKGFPFVIAGIIVLLAVIGSGVLAARWWRGEKGGSVAVAEASPSPTATPTPTPTPASPPVVRRSPPKSPPKKESKLKSIWNKTKRILLP